MIFCIKYAAGSIGFAVLLSLFMINPAFARGIPDPGPPTPITISGTITDHGKPMSGLGVVAWCGNFENFGGWARTNEKGWFEIHTTNSLKCPLGAYGFLEIFHDGEIAGFALTDVIIHTQTTVNVKLEDHNRVIVPELGWVGGAVSIAAGIGIIAFGRQRVFLR